MSLALQCLKDQIDIYERAVQQVERERQIRDNLIQDARINGDVSYRRLSMVTGLSRNTLHKIVDSARNPIDE